MCTILLILGFLLSLLLTIFMWFTDLYTTEIYKVKDSNILRYFRYLLPNTYTVLKYFKFYRNLQLKTVVYYMMHGENLQLNR